MADDEPTLLAQLADWIDETLATKALAYILNRSTASRQALVSILRDGGINAVPIDNVVPEVNYPGRGRVDIACYRKGDTAPPVLIEVKFLAELTNNQPSGYLEWLLKSDEESVLLFVVPESRISALWPDLKNRAEQGDRKLVEVEAERRCMRVDGTRCHLMVVSWGTLLDSMAIRSKASGESPGIEADIQQLSGLARHMNESAERVSPFTVDYLELGSDVGNTRTRDLRQIVDDAVKKAVDDGWATSQGLSTSRRSSASPHGRYFRLSNTPLNRELWLGVNNDQWKKSGTPLWLWFFDPRDLELLRNMGALLPGGLDQDYVPIDLKPRVEVNYVVDDVVRQIKDISDRVTSFSSTG